MKCRVWNDNPHTDWTETFKGDKIFIKSKGFVEMEFYEAHEFKGQFSPIKIKPDETQDEKSFKMIRVEKIEAEEPEELEETYSCNLCKKEFPDEESLIFHSEKNHTERMVTDDDAEAQAPKKRGRPKGWSPKAKEIEA